MGSLARRQRWCALLLCAQLTACAAPGEPTVINPLVHQPTVTPARPGPMSGRLATRPPPHLPVVAATSPVMRASLRKRDDTIANGRTAVRPNLGATTIEPGSPALATTPPPPAAAPLVPAPSIPASFSPLSPAADPVALVPAGSTAGAAGPKLTARDTTLTPGPSLCSLGRDSTADDVILNTQPCPVDLRPTLKPVEPAP